MYIAHVHAHRSLSSSDKTILFSANDPGGGNAILPVVRALVARGIEAYGVATGPALTMFQKAGLPVVDGVMLSDEQIAQVISERAPALFLAGSSIGESIDKKIFRLLNTVPSVYVIDFWSHYGHRFVEARSDLSHVPTHICAIDERMRAELLTEGFPESVIRVTGNPHFDHFTEGITRLGEVRERVLYISQPVREDMVRAGAHDRGYDEYEALEGLLKVLPTGLSVSIRLHPRDELHKYDAYLGERASIAPEDTLEAALSHAGLVVGMFSPVLMQAAFAGKPTISFQPSLVGPDALPTNALGITLGVHDAAALGALLAKYGAGDDFPKRSRADLFPVGATERVVSVIDALLE